MERDLRLTLRTLHASDITAAAQITGDGRIQVWLGDRTLGVCDAAFFPLHEAARAADWLAERAVKYFPKSDFAKVHRLIALAAATAGSKPA
jgi:hypothetical protein